MMNQKTPDVMMAIGMKKPGPGLPKSIKGSFGVPKSSSLQTHYTPPSTPAGPTADPNMAGASGAKTSQEEAGYLPPNNLCGGCEYFTKETNDCAKVDGPVEAGGGCKLFEAAGGDAMTPEMDKDPMAKAASGINPNPDMSGGM